MNLIEALEVVKKKCPSCTAKVYAKLAQEKDGAVRERLCWFVVSEAKEWKGREATKVKKIIQKASA